MQHSYLIYVAGTEGMDGAEKAPIRLHQRHKNKNWVGAELSQSRLNASRAD